MSIQVYYHIFAADTQQYFDIIKEQIDCIIQSPIYSKIDKINVCLTGNYKINFDRTIEYISSLDKKFVFRRCEFGDKTYERFTLDALKDDVLKEDNNMNKYLYIHSKGGSTVLKECLKPIKHWRQCMMYFLLTRGQECLKKLDEYDTVGIFKHPTHHIPHYSGNFWWATGTYLKNLFTEYEIDSDYLGPEMYLFKSNPSYCDLYPMPNNYNGYKYCYPFDIYKDYEIE